MRMETDPVSETLCSFVFLEYQTMDKVQKSSNLVLYPIVRTHTHTDWQSNLVREVWRHPLRPSSDYKSLLTLVVPIIFRFSVTYWVFSMTIHRPTVKVIWWVEPVVHLKGRSNFYLVHGSSKVLQNVGNLLWDCTVSQDHTRSKLSPPPWKPRISQWSLTIKCTRGTLELPISLLHFNKWHFNTTNRKIRYKTPTVCQV
jgi:hypothetical protein